MTALARGDVVLEDLGEEVMAYDPESAMAHVLSPVAAAVLLLCDGQRDETAIAASLGPQDQGIDLAVVRAAIASLDAVGLLVPALA